MNTIITISTKQYRSNRTELVINFDKDIPAYTDVSIVLDDETIMELMEHIVAKRQNKTYHAGKIQ